MTDNFDETALEPSGMRQRKPLAGVQIMLVDDSRAVSEAMRMMAIRCGARIRRADCIATATRHLKVFRPSVVIIDLGLPDGNGVELARSIGSIMEPRPAILVISAADEEVTAAAAAAAGADGYLTKPITSLAAFEDAVLAILPEASPQLRVVGQNEFDVKVAGSDGHLLDLENAQDLLTDALREKDTKALGFCARFLIGLSGTVEDWGLFDAATALARGSGRNCLSLGKKPTTCDRVLL